MTGPAESDRLAAEIDYLNWCRQRHRDPEDVGSMLDYEAAVHSEFEKDYSHRVTEYLDHVGALGSESEPGSSSG